VIDNLGLIHVSGCLYDPVVGRFLSSDPLGARWRFSVPQPAVLLNHNPLAYIDPSGKDCTKNEGRGVEVVDKLRPALTHEDEWGK
jgi:RHS repeat-associated protein